MSGRVRCSICQSRAHDDSYHGAAANVKTPKSSGASVSHQPVSGGGRGAFVCNSCGGYGHIASECPSGSGGGRGRGSNRGGFRGRGRGAGRGASGGRGGSLGVFSTTRAGLRCYNCQQYGHVAGECREVGHCRECGLDGHRHENCPTLVGTTGVGNYNAVRGGGGRVKNNASGAVKKQPAGAPVVACAHCQSVDHQSHECKRFCLKCMSIAHKTGDCTVGDVVCDTCGDSGHVAGACHSAQLRGKKKKRFQEKKFDTNYPGALLNLLRLAGLEAVVKYITCLSLVTPVCDEKGEVVLSFCGELSVRVLPEGCKQVVANCMYSAANSALIPNFVPRQCFGTTLPFKVLDVGAVDAIPGKPVEDVYDMVAQNFAAARFQGTFAQPPAGTKGVPPLLHISGLPVEKGVDKGVLTTIGPGGVVVDRDASVDRFFAIDTALAIATADLNGVDVIRYLSAFGYASYDWTAMKPEDFQHKPEALRYVKNCGQELGVLRDEIERLKGQLQLQEEEEEVEDGA